jgi:hypothetical protein
LNHSFGAEISMDLYFDKHHYPIYPKGRCQGEAGRILTISCHSSSHLHLSGLLSS